MYKWIFLLGTIFLTSSCASSGSAQLVLDDLERIQSAYRQKSIKHYSPTSSVTILLTPEDETVHEYYDDNFSSYEVIGESYVSGEVPQQIAVEKFGKSIGANFVLRYMKLTGTEAKVGSKPINSSSRTNVWLNTNDGTTIYGRATTSSTRRDNFVYSVPTFYNAFMFLRKPENTNAPWELSDQDLQGLSEPDSDPFIGFWENEYWRFRVYALGDDYIGFVEDFFGTVPVSVTDNEYRFRFNKHTKSGVMWYGDPENSGKSAEKMMVSLVSKDRLRFSMAEGNPPWNLHRVSGPKK